MLETSLDQKIYLSTSPCDMRKSIEGLAAIVQAKDAVESARQTIVSQHELVKLNHENDSKKVEKIVKLLKMPKLTEKKVKALQSKLAKRQRKLDYWTTFMVSHTFPPVTFGTKLMFLRRCKGLITKQEWQDRRKIDFTVEAISLRVVTQILELFLKKIIAFWRFLR